jgi:uncharacterized membrane protein
MQIGYVHLVLGVILNFATIVMARGLSIANHFLVLIHTFWCVVLWKHLQNVILSLTKNKITFFSLEKKNNIIYL